jgi:hypothetical protein
MEMQTHLFIAERLWYLKPAEAAPVLASSDDVGLLLRRLIAALRRRAE